jgi:hypothetical protein
MDLFEKDGEIYKSVPAGGHGGGVTSSVVVKATEAEAAAFRATQDPAGEPEAGTGVAELKQDGPTVQEWVAAGYKASEYPPSDYASKSSAEDIATAVAAEEQAKVDADKLKAEAEKAKT